MLPQHCDWKLIADSGSEGLPWQHPAPSHLPEGGGVTAWTTETVPVPHDVSTGWREYEITAMLREFIDRVGYEPGHYINVSIVTTDTSPGTWAIEVDAGTLGSETNELIIEVGTPGVPPYWFTVPELTDLFGADRLVNHFSVSNQDVLDADETAGATLRSISLDSSGNPAEYVATTSDHLSIDLWTGNVSRQTLSPPIGGFAESGAPSAAIEAWAFGELDGAMSPPYDTTYYNHLRCDPATKAYLFGMIYRYDTIDARAGSAVYDWLGGLQLGWWPEDFVSAVEVGGAIGWQSAGSHINTFARDAQSVGDLAFIAGYWNPDTLSYYLMQSAVNGGNPFLWRDESNITSHPSWPGPLPDATISIIGWKYQGEHYGRFLMEFDEHKPQWASYVRWMAQAAITPVADGPMSKTGYTNNHSIDPRITGHWGTFSTTFSIAHNDHDGYEAYDDIFQKGPTQIGISAPTFGNTPGFGFTGGNIPAEATGILSAKFNVTLAGPPIGMEITVGLYKVLQSSMDLPGTPSLSDNNPYTDWSAGSTTEVVTAVYPIVPADVLYEIDLTDALNELFDFEGGAITKVNVYALHIGGSPSAFFGRSEESTLEVIYKMG